MSVKKLILGAAIVLSIANANAQTWDCGNKGDNVKATLMGNTLIISGVGDMKNYYFDNLPPWHSSREQIQNVFINNGVTSIGNHAFSYSYNLTSATIYNGITNIGNHAFYYCSKLTYITIPNSVTSIESHAFSYCHKLTTVTIPNSVTSIGGYAFYYCRKLTYITIPNSVKHIGENAFPRSTSVKIVDNVAEIADANFNNSTSAKSTDNVQSTVSNSTSVITVDSLATYPYDIITLRSGEQIKAKITEISTSEIRYKRHDHLDGPSRVVSLAEVFTINYENGTREVVNPLSKTNSGANETQTAQTTQTTTQQQVQQQPSTPLASNLQSEFYGIGTNDKAMLAFFGRNNFTDYYNRFNAACKAKKGGSAWLGIGIGMTGVGVIFMVSSVVSVTKAANSSSVGGAMQTVRKSNTLMIVGGTAMGLGQLFTIIGIPVSAKAGGKKKAIKNDFAKEKFGISGYSYVPTLEIGIMQNGGLGFTLHF